MFDVVLYTLFALSGLLLLHTYVLYPLTIFIISRLIKKEYQTSSTHLPSVTVLISAYNEEKVIGETIATLLKSDYPREKLTIIVGSDNSTDGTNTVVAAVAEQHPSVAFINFPERRGKASIINDLMQLAGGEIIVFADANTLYRQNAIRELVKYYVDSRVGGVSGKLHLLHLAEARRTGSHEDSYWNLETLLKKKEGDIGCLIGSNGGIYSIRKQLFVPIPTAGPVMDDFFISMKVLEAGYDFLYASEVAAEEFVAPSADIEFQRKIRNNSISLSTLPYLRKLLMPSAGLVAYGLISHKVFRWYSPVFVLAIFITAALLSVGSAFFMYIVSLQLCFYLLALLGYIFKKTGIAIAPFSLAYYFVLTNVAMLIGIYRYRSGRQTAFWQSTKR